MSGQGMREEMDREQMNIEMLEEIGYCSGIENYSRHLSLREEGESPYTLLDFFGRDYLLVIEESHVTLPQVRAMYNGDRPTKFNGWRENAYVGALSMPSVNKIYLNQCHILLNLVFL